MATKGTWVTSGYQRGDLLIFNFGSGIAHIGMLVKVDADGSYITYEGNTSLTSNDNGGAVMERVRYKSQIVGACRPAYPSTAVMEEIIALIEEQIGVTENPSGSNRVKYNTWYYGREVNGSAYPWCVVFIAWCFNEAGYFDLFMGGQKTASCTALVTYYGYGTTTTTEGSDTVNITLDVLKKGGEGEQVATLQRLLNALDHDCGSVDGDFGAKTLAAAKAFQKAEGLTVDGIVGTNTWTALLK